MTNRNTAPQNAQELNFGPQTPVAEVQRIFHQTYPFLKLVFFKKAHDEGAPSMAADQLEATGNFADIGMRGDGGSISIAPSRTVAELEMEMEERCGLHVQVFRKSDNLWIQTSVSDHWTLARQNEDGKEISTFCHNLHGQEAQA